MGSSIRTLFNLLGKYKSWYISAALLLVLSILVRSFEPKILQIAIDKVISLSNPDSVVSTTQEIDPIAHAMAGLIPDSISGNIGWLLIALAVMYVLISLFHGGFLFASSVINAWCAENLSKSVRDRMFRHIQHLPLSFFTKITRGELIQRSTGDVDTIKGFLSSQVITLVRLVSIFAFAFAMIALMSWKYALICMVLSPFLIGFSYVFTKKEKKVWRIHEAESDKLNNLIQENLNGIRTVIAYANEDHERGRFKEQNTNTRAIGMRHNRLHTFFWPISDFLGFAQISISIIAGGYFAMTGEITIGQLLASYTYIGMVAWPLRQLGRTLSEMGMAQVAIERLGEIIDAVEEDDEGVETEVLQGHIVFDKVTFGYKDDDIYALSNISFEVKPGEKIAMVGPTGSGKSSLIKLLLRLYEPNEGSITLDGQPLNTYKRSFLRKKIGMAHQKAFLFSTSIRENIAYSQPKSPLERVLKAANVAQFEEISGVFPEGYETLVGEKGVTLSGGQKQRVALARTLLPEPDVLILDDITSAVDTETEQAMFQALKDEMSTKTTFILSHRITSIQQADRVFVFNKGQLVQQGTPTELEKVPGYYQEIHKIQTEVEKTILEEIKPGK